MVKGKKTPEAVLCGQRMREARGDRSQSEFAKLLGISASRLGNYEQGTRKLPIRLAVRAQKAIGIPAAYLMGLVDEADRDLLMAPDGARSALLSAIRQLQPQ